MKQLASLLAYLMLGLMLAVPAWAVDYDVVILNGRVMDPETNFDGVVITSYSIHYTKLYDTLAIESNIVSGSITRPFRMTRS